MLKRYTDAELKGFLDDLKSDRLERKETFKGDVPQKARQAICAFANDLPGHDEPGVLFIGAKDDGSPSGLSVTDELLLSLADMKTDGNILPLPTLVVEKRHLKGADMAVITVHPSHMPQVRPCRKITRKSLKATTSDYTPCDAPLRPPSLPGKVPRPFFALHETRRPAVPRQALKRGLPTAAEICAVLLAACCRGYLPCEEDLLRKKLAGSGPARSRDKPGCVMSFAIRGLMLPQGYPTNGKRHTWLVTL